MFIWIIGTSNYSVSLITKKLKVDAFKETVIKFKIFEGPNK